MCKKKMLVALGLLATAACTDITGPPVDGPHDEFAAALARADSRAGASVGDHILEHAPTAPALETYELSFWAVRGRARYVQIRYKGNKADGHDGDPAVDRQAVGAVDGEVFLSLYIPWNALSRYPDGERIRWGERVLITISVDPSELYVSLEPSGLRFNRRARPWLYVSYNGANPDFDGDGNVDRVDQYIEDNHLNLWSFDYPSGASAGPGIRASVAGGASSGNSPPKKKSFLGKIGKLSDHVVSW
jgi:hypothetical protein